MCSKQHTEMVILLDHGMSSINHPVRPNVLETWPGNAVQRIHTRLWAKQGCRAWTWTRRSDRDPFEEPMQKRNLGQKGEWEETIPSNQEVHKCRHNRGGKWEGSVQGHRES